MQRLPSVAYPLLALLLMAGCTSTKGAYTEDFDGEKLPRPARIIVYDFAVTPDDLPVWSHARTDFSQASAFMKADELEEGRKVGAALAEELVSKIDAMGLTAVRTQNQPAPQLGDVAISGYFASIDEGSAVKRVVIGFGQGTAEVQVHAEGYRSTEQGMQRLGHGDLTSGGGSKTPGIVVPALVTVVTANPVGLVVGGAVKAEGEVSGRTTDTGSAKRIADELAEHLKIEFRKLGWI